MTMRLYLAFLSAIVVAALAIGVWAQTDLSESRRPVVGRSVVATTYGIVAASQPLAARAGVQVLERGGNAADAAIAANAAIGLMEPTGNGIGGDLFALVYEARTGELHGLNASGWAPAGRTVELLRSKGFDEMPQRGIYSVTVPGVVAGWDALRERFGSLPFSELLAPAIFYAENGFPLSPVIAGSWGRAAPFLSEHPNSRETFLIGDLAPAAGELFRNPDLGGSLRRIAEHGRDGYYKGQTAQAIVQISREQGGTFTAEDLSEFHAEWVTPISTTYRGWTEKILAVALVSPTAALCEEFLYRGYLYAFFTERLESSPWAWFLSSVAFGLAHSYQGPGGVLRAGLLGALLAYPVVIYGSIYPAMVAHFIVDVVALAWMGPRFWKFPDPSP